MYCLSAISLLIFQIVCINIKATSSDQKQQLADTLDRLLRSPGWININVRAKYQNAAHEIESFSGQALYTYDLDLNGEYDMNMENRIVHVKNVDTKYDMIVHLLGCAYTKAMLTFINLLDITILECTKAKRRCRDNAGKQITSDCAKHEVHLTGEQRELALKDSVDLVNFKTIFGIAMGQLENHNLMLDFMSTALRYLIGLAPLEKMQNDLMQDLQRIIIDIDGIKHLAAYISFTIPCDNATCYDDQKYRQKLKIFSEKVSRSTDINKEKPLVEFKNNHCILPDNEQIEQLKRDYRNDVLIEEIKKLETEVFTSYYTYLGFVYDFDNQATILAPDNIQNNNNA